MEDARYGLVDQTISYLQNLLRSSPIFLPRQLLIKRHLLPYGAANHCIGVMEEGVLTLNAALDTKDDPYVALIKVKTSRQWLSS